MIIKRIYENQNLLSLAIACFLPGRAKDLSAPRYIYTLIQLVVTPTLTQMPTVAGQPEFESQDFNPRMKIRMISIRMISIILCDDYFHRNGYLKFYANRLNKSWGCTLCIVSERHELTITVLNFWCEGASAFCRHSQLKEGITDNGLDPKSSRLRLKPDGTR